MYVTNETVSFNRLGGYRNNVFKTPVKIRFYSLIDHVD